MSDGSGFQVPPELRDHAYSSWFADFLASHPTWHEIVNGPTPPDEIPAALGGTRAADGFLVPPAMADQLRDRTRADILAAFGLEPWHIGLAPAPLPTRWQRWWARLRYTSRSAVIWDIRHAIAERAYRLIAGTHPGDDYRCNDCDPGWEP